MHRRDFLRSSCQACAALAFVPLASLALESCSSTGKLAVENGLLKVPVGSLSDRNRVLIKAKGLADKLLLVKGADGSYTALVMNCPHKNGPVSEKNGQLVCAWHGSTFNDEGRVMKGPAKTDLKRYPVEQVGEMLEVRVA